MSSETWAQRCAETLHNVPEPLQPAHLHRQAARLLTGALGAMDNPPAEGSEPAITDYFTQGPEHMFHLVRTQRYAVAGALGIEAIRPQLVYDRSQPDERHSVNLGLTCRSQLTDPYNPYMHFANNLIATFQAGSATFQAERPAKAAWLRQYHDKLALLDSTTQLTRLPITSLAIDTGNEGPFEAAGLAAFTQQLVGTAARPQRPNNDATLLTA